MKLKQNAAALSVALALVAASVTHATPVLQLSDGVAAPITITDNLAGDANPVAGAVSFTGVINGWSILVSSGITKPLVGSAASPVLDLSWQVTRTSAAGGANLTICFSENDFNLATPRAFTTAAGGTAGPAGNTVQVRSYFDLGNTTLAQTTLLTSHLFTSPPNGFSATDAGLVLVPADSSVAFTIKLVLSQAVGSITSGDIELASTPVSVPEGGSMVTFLGTALLALGVFAVRRKSVRA